MRALGWKQCRKGSNILWIIGNQIKLGPECYPGNGFLDLPHIQTRKDNPIGESLYGCGSRSDLAAEFNICFQFQVHMADCINGSKSGGDLKKTACFWTCQHNGTWARVTGCGCVRVWERECVKRKVAKDRWGCLCVTECSQNYSSRSWVMAAF